MGEMEENGEGRMGKWEKRARMNKNKQHGKMGKLKKMNKMDNIDKNRQKWTKKGEIFLCESRGSIST